MDKNQVNTIVKNLSYNYTNAEFLQPDGDHIDRKRLRKFQLKFLTIVLYLLDFYPEIHFNCKFLTLSSQDL